MTQYIPLRGNIAKAKIDYSFIEENEKFIILSFSNLVTQMTH